MGQRLPLASAEGRPIGRDFSLAAMRRRSAEDRPVKVQLPRFCLKTLANRGMLVRYAVGMELNRVDYASVDRARRVCELLAHDDSVSRSGRDTLKDAERVLAWVASAIAQGSF